MENKKKFKPDPDLKFMDQVRGVLRYPIMPTARSRCMNHSLRSLFASQIIFSLRSKGDWIKRYLKFYEMKRHPREMGRRRLSAG
ncbi:hypothetical protein SCARR_03723 [Pontiella sulfatireligans]|uniref:Uncharacterized protein n=1 Tax=Pontiella sulfatireligans TaxID=2750658 RepID=A0A6C2UNK9_9BACT|nr:hypothetical protein SCARR_03723 [Pontiella sulfatireligans]